MDEYQLTSRRDSRCSFSSLSLPSAPSVFSLLLSSPFSSSFCCFFGAAASPVRSRRTGEARHVCDMSGDSNCSPSVDQCRSPLGKPHSPISTFSLSSPLTFLSVFIDPAMTSFHPPFPTLVSRFLPLVTFFCIIDVFPGDFNVSGV